MKKPPRGVVLEVVRNAVDDVVLDTESFLFPDVVIPVFVDQGRIDRVGEQVGAV